MAYCGICGKDKPLKQVAIEGSILNVCDDCKGHGKIVNSNDKKLLFKKKGYSNYKVPELDDSKLIRSDFTNILKKEREQKNLTQKELASKIGVKENIIHKLETGNMHPTEDIIKKLNKFFEISFYEKNINSNSLDKPNNNNNNDSSNLNNKKLSEHSEGSQEFVLGDFIKKR